MALAVAQSAHTHSVAGGSTVNATFAGATTTGNLVVAIVTAYDGVPGPASVSDSRGNTWTRDAFTPGGVNEAYCAVYSSVLVSAGAAHQVTYGATSPGSNTYNNIDLVEVSGAPASGAFDATSQNTATGVPPYTTGPTPTLAQAAEIVVVSVGVDSGSTTSTLTQDATYTLIGENESGNFVISNAAYKIVAATTPVNHSWAATYPSSKWVAIAATYKAATVAGVTGTIAVTEATDTPAIIGTSAPPAGTLTGTIAVTEATDTPAIAGTFTGSTPPTHRFATAIAGRKIVDQAGAVYLMRTMSSWAMTENLSNAEITQALEGLAAQGFNAATICYGGGIDFGGWHRYTNKAGAAFWTGTPWGSTFGAAWSSVDWAVSECDRLGMTCCLSLFYSWGSNGAATDFNAVSTTAARNVGVALATRYLAYDNIVWHVMFDMDPGFNANIDALYDGINDTEGPTRRPVRWAEPNNGSSTYGSIITAGYASFNVTLNGFYSYAGNNTEIVEASYNLAGATTIPTGDVEPDYDGHNALGGNQGFNLRHRSYATFFEGGVYANYGHEDWWCFGFTNPFGFSEGLTWQQVTTDIHTTQQSYCWAFLDAYVADAAWAPTSTFVTTGAGTGSAKAAIGSSGSVAAAYFPTNRAVTVDTTILTGTGNVRLRWFDPMTGGYAVIAASEAQNAARAVTYPGNHADGSADYVLLVELVTLAVTGTVAVNEATDLAAITGTVAAPTDVTGTVAATETTDTAAIVGAVTTGPVTGVVAATEAPDLAVIVGFLPDAPTTPTGPLHVTVTNPTPTLRVTVTPRGNA